MLPLTAGTPLQRAGAMRESERTMGKIITKKHHSLLCGLHCTHSHTGAWWHLHPLHPRHLLPCCCGNSWCDEKLCSGSGIPVPCGVESCTDGNSHCLIFNLIRPRSEKCIRSCHTSGLHSVLAGELPQDLLGCRLICFLAG